MQHVMSNQHPTFIPHLPNPNSVVPSWTFSLSVLQERPERDFRAHGTTMGRLWEPTRVRQQAGKAAAALAWLLACLPTSVPLSAALFLTLIAVPFFGFRGEMEAGVVEQEEEAMMR